VIWFLRHAVFDDGKNLPRKALVSSSYVVMESGGNDCSKARA